MSPHSASRAPGGPPRFTPTKIFLRGWCPIGSTGLGLPEASVVAALKQLLEKLPDNHRSSVSRVSAPYYRNFQGIFHMIQDCPAKDVFSCRLAIQTSLDSDPITLGNHKVYSTVEASPSQKILRSALRLSHEAWRLVRGVEASTLKMDWASGELWSLSPAPEMKVGYFHRQSENWRWNQATLAHFNIPASDLDTKRALLENE